MSLGLFKCQFTAMGSPCEIQIYARSEAKASSVFQLISNDIHRLQQKYSRYIADSYLSEINKIAVLGKAIRLDQETASLIDYACTCYEQSDGLFDITTGALRRLWQFRDPASFRVPTKEKVSEVLTYVGWDKVSWCSPQLTFSSKYMEIDFGGIVKEYAADRAGSLAHSEGIDHGFVNLGGDIRVIGGHPDGSPWKIGIQDPRIKNQVLSVVSLTCGAMASSGDYERCLIINGRRYSHILNPKTGFPVDFMAAVTVVSEYCVLAGSASTIAMLKGDLGIDWLSSLALPHLWVTVDGQVGGGLYPH